MLDGAVQQVGVGQEGAMCQLWGSATRIGLN